ncbi:MAG TPA: nuclear transport factor 2 family protein [Thermoanaerobaculia bacterium]|nr:nuclear transport factor 2 family protein [Thermoanaerobaculia bacterium]
MKPRLLLYAVLAALAAFALQADDAGEVRRLDGELAVATWTGDALWFDRNLADDYTLTTPTGSIRTKRDVMNELSTPGLKMDPFDPLEVQVRLYGDSAVVTGRMLQRFLLGRVRYANDLRYTDVYVKKKGRWLLVSGHTSNVAVRR